MCYYLLIVNSWNDFIDKTKNRKPINLLIEAVDKLEARNGLALDLGCGAGVDAKYLAEKGFSVEAVDLDKDSIKQTEQICKGLNITAIQEDIAGYGIKSDNYNFIISWNSLPFLNKERVLRVLENIQKGLKKGGIFVFSVFGPEDDWAKTRKNMSFFTIKEIKRVLLQMDFIKITEQKQKKAGATGGIKFWHEIQGIAEKK